MLIACWRCVKRDVEYDPPDNIKHELAMAMTGDNDAREVVLKFLEETDLPLCDKCQKIEATKVWRNNTDKRTTNRNRMDPKRLVSIELMHETTEGFHYDHLKDMKSKRSVYKSKDVYTREQEDHHRELERLADELLKADDLKKP